jgi:hypothetical protein
MRKRLFIAYFVCSIFALQATDPERMLSLRTGNINSALPFTGFPVLFSDIYRPYVEAGYGISLWQREKHIWWLDARLGYFNHRFIQQAMPLTVNLKYERKFNTGTSAFATLGGGYIHAFPHEGRYRLNENGDYQRVRSPGRPQAGFGLSLGASQRLSSNWSVLLEYRILMQAPFVNTYVPLLPYGIIQTGIIYLL